MNYAGGEWTILAVGAFIILLALVALVMTFVEDTGRFAISLPVFIVGLVTMGCGFWAAHSRYETRSAWHDLGQQGYVVVDVDLSVPKAVVIGPDGCTFTREVVHSEVNGYELTLDGRVVTPEQLTCKK